jgi:arylsulfatase A-like enzyme
MPWLTLHKDDRFFVFLHVYDPHDPYKPRSPFDTQWADGEQAEEHARRTEAVKSFIQDESLAKIGLPSRDELIQAEVDPEDWVAYEKDWYDGSILAMDREIARLMTHLQSLGILETTLFAFTSDHGEEFLEHGRSWHGQGVYSELTQVPLLFYGAGIPSRGAVFDQPVALIDVMPTLLDACDLRAPAGMQGRSLMPLMRGAAGASAWKSRPVVSEKVHLAQDHSSPPPQGAGMVAIQDERWKLIHNEPRVDGRAEWELFDRQQDPLDRINVADGHPEAVAHMRALLDEWRAETAELRLDAESAELDAEDLRRLREMGYAK